MVVLYLHMLFANVLALPAILLILTEPNLLKRNVNTYFFPLSL